MEFKTILLDIRIKSNESRDHYHEEANLAVSPTCFRRRNKCHFPIQFVVSFIIFILKKAFTMQKEKNDNYLLFGVGLFLRPFK